MHAAQIMENLSDRTEFRDAAQDFDKRIRYHGHDGTIINREATTFKRPVPFHDETSKPPQRARRDRYSISALSNCMDVSNGT